MRARNASFLATDAERAINGPIQCQSMDKHRVVTILIGLAVFTAPRLCSARIGETLGECKIRYGVRLKVISHSWPDYPEYCFKLGDVEIRVRLYKGVSAQEAFHIPGRMLTNYQIQEILQKNGAGSGKITSDHITLPDHSDVLIIETREFEKIFRKDIGTGF